MNATYPYYYQEQPTDSLDIDDIGNCYLSANNDMADFYYLVIQTELGITKIMEYGPYNESTTPDFLTFTYQQFDYNEMKIGKMIDKFLNNPRRGITQAFSVDYESIKDNIINPMEYMYD